MELLKFGYCNMTKGQKEHPESRSLLSLGPLIKAFAIPALVSRLLQTDRVMNQAVSGQEEVPWLPGSPSVNSQCFLAYAVSS